jgi:hypothetical protein
MRVLEDSDIGTDEHICRQDPTGMFGDRIEAGEMTDRSE